MGAEGVRLLDISEGGAVAKEREETSAKHVREKG